MLETSATALLVLLVSKELFQAGDSTVMQRAGRFLHVPVLTLLVVFLAAAILRIAEIAA